MKANLTLAATLLVLVIHSSVQSAEKSNPNIENSPVYQMRIYEIFDTNKDAFHSRFKEHAARIMARYNFRIIDMWEAKGDGKTEFVYVLKWPDEETMREQWKAFLADAEWTDIKQKTLAEHGKMVGEIREKVMRTVSYSRRLVQGQ